MKVNDLYSIIRELREITILQASLLEYLKDPEVNSVYEAQKLQHEKLNQILLSYEKFNI
jgi:hypothetical protein